MKRLLIFFIFLISILIPIQCFGYESSDGIDSNYNEYIDTYDLSSFDVLDDDVKDFLNSLGLLDFDVDSINNISVSSFIKHIYDIVLKKSNGPVKCAVIVFAFIIISSIFSSFSNKIVNENESLYSTITSLAVSLVLVTNLTDCISLSCSTIKLCADFAYAFFPAFCIIVATSGLGATSVSVNTLLLTLSQGVNYIANIFFIPITNCFMVLGICSSIRQDLNVNSAMSMLKRVITGAISSLSAIFVSILSVKTAVSSKADALGLRSIRFAINSVVPVIGSSISEGLLSIQNYSSLIKTSVGIVGIIAVVCVFLPALVEVTLWRIVLSLSVVCADVFGEKNISKTVNAFKDSLLIINVLLILTMVTTIISIGILIAAKSVV